ncbi:MAG: RnfABCDGE type electron transport complex subunit D [Lachnospiraceae bacterium]|nr:RnfABCDGE type electron transport complex subunit D [Lachnospiraceae bacterium]
MSELKKVSSNPHVRARLTTGHIMFAVVIALLPTSIYGIYNFGPKAAILILITVLSSVMTELIYEIVMKKKVTISDFSAVVTGLLLALNLPVSVPWWIGVIGGVFAILVVKMLFGGLGQNFMNPALAARCFLLISFTGIMTNFDCDAYTGATPLAILKSGESVNVYNMVLGRCNGTIGETSMAMIVVGAIFLIVLGVIDLRVPGSYIVSFVMFLGLFGGQGFDTHYIAAHLAGGGLMLGAFFMATDYVTRPITVKGQYLYGILLGFLTFVFRVFGPSAEGVSYAIIIGNLLVPLIEKVTRPRAFGKKWGTKK